MLKDKFQLTSIFILILFSLGSLVFYYYFQQGLNLAYNDATSHLNIARRVFDSLTPGLVQIGSTWLPLLHLLEITFIWNDFMWHSGLAGAVVSMVSFVFTGVFCYKSVFLLTKNKWASFISVIILISNANFLYLQTTAMFEPLLILSLSGFFYYLLLWQKKDNILHLIYSSIFICIGTLTRYDGWFVLMFAVGYVFLYTIIKSKKYFKAEGTVILFATLAGYGVVLWFLYNLLIFGSPTYFSTNEFSSYAQQEEFFNKGLLPTKHNLPLSFIVYTVSTMLNQGVIYTFLVVIALIIFTFKYYKSFSKWSYYLLFVPYVFNISALYLGHSVIRIPFLPPFSNSFFNIRYGIMLLPAFVISIGFISKYRLLRPIILSCVLAQVILFYSLLPGNKEHLNFVTLKDTEGGFDILTDNAAKWLTANYKGGLVLVSSASSESFIFTSDLPMNKFITEGTGDYWRSSLDLPSKHAAWVVFFPGFSDRVGRRMTGDIPAEKDLRHNYDLAFKNDRYLIYRLKDYNSKFDEDIKNNTIVKRGINKNSEYPLDYQILQNIFR